MERVPLVGRVMAGQFAVAHRAGPRVQAGDQAAAVAERFAVHLDGLRTDERPPGLVVEGRRDPQPAVVHAPQLAGASRVVQPRQAGRRVRAGREPPQRQRPVGRQQCDRN